MNKPWERQPQEPIKAFVGFQKFLDLGPDRTLRATAKELGMREIKMRNWSANYHWLARAAAWEEYLSAAQQKKAKSILEANSEKWARRAVSLREDEFGAAEELLKRAKEMLGFSLTERTIVTETRRIGNEAVPVAITIIKPVRWSMRDAAAFIELASKLMRISAELETSRDRLDININDETKRLKNARLALERVREDMINTISENTSDAERQEIIRQLPGLVAAEFQVDEQELMADEPPESQHSRPQLTSGDEEDMPDVSGLPPAIIVDGILIEEDIPDSSDLVT